MYFTPKELADRFKISVRQVTHLARVGTLPAMKIGKLWRFRITEIEAWERNQGIDVDQVDDLVKQIVNEI